MKRIECVAVRLKVILFTVFCTINAPFLNAQDGADWIEPEQDWYQFELILFKYLQPQRDVLQHEYRPEPLQKPKALSYWYDLGTPLTANQYPVLERGDIALSDAANYIARAKDTRLIALKAWKQPLAEGEQSLPFSINEGEAFADGVNELQGTVSVRRSRFIHADIELELAEFWTLPYHSLLDWFFEPEDWAWPVDFLVQPLAFDHSALRAKGSAHIAVNSGRMKQSRRLRSDERHYIDHPLFGVIVMVNKTLSPAEAEYERLENSEESNTL